MTFWGSVKVDQVNYPFISSIKSLPIQFIPLDMLMFEMWHYAIEKKIDMFCWCVKRSTTGRDDLQDICNSD